ncbi:neuropeptide CCHamide-1 receptor isoform X3 [Dermatophagoides farinae]|uniref:7 transmembrane receptor (Rhodopsin) n=2 Tax=Dermatophagoides farinae TaxID=6954 RepID=A0A922HZ27_DERFA|nr:7 transmembrane receptor (rhodopsin) [Dermatophagoides farinae]
MELINNSSAMNMMTTYINTNQSTFLQSYPSLSSSYHHHHYSNLHHNHQHHHHNHNNNNNNNPHHLVNHNHLEQQRSYPDIGFNMNNDNNNGNSMMNSFQNLFNEWQDLSTTTTTTATINLSDNNNGFTINVDGGSEIFNDNNNNVNETLLLSLTSSIHNNDSIDYNIGGGSGGGDYIPYESRPETYIVPIIFFFIFVVGTIGNGTVIYIFYQHKSMRTVANVYILSLAIGDLAMILITVPFVSTIYTFESWPYGLAVCKISEFARDLSIGVTVFTLTSLSVQRYTATHHPIRYLSHKGRTTLTQANTFIWLLSALLAIPGAYYSFIMKVAVNDEHTINVCYPFPSQLGDWYPKTVVMIKFLCYYAIPLIIITIFYSLMARSLIRTTENPVCNNDSHHKLLKNRRKISRIVLGLVVIFAICFFPNHVFMFWYHFNTNSNENYNTFWHVWRIIGFVLSFLNSCLNPIVLCCISGVFRSHFKRYIFACCHSSQQRSRETSITPGFRLINSIDLNTKV